MALAAGAAGGTQTTHTGPPQPRIIVPNTGSDLVTLSCVNRASGSIKPWLASS